MNQISLESLFSPTQAKAYMEYVAYMTEKTRAEAQAQALPSRKEKIDSLQNEGALAKLTKERQSLAVREMTIPLMETSEQQRIMDLEEQLEQEKESHKETKSRLEIAEVKLLDRAAEVEGLRNTIQCLVLRDQKSSKDNFESDTQSKFQMLKMELEKVSMKFDELELENDKKFDDLKEQISKGQEQKELQKLKDLNEKLVSENARLQEELSDRVTETKWLNDCIEKFEETDVKKDEKIQELEETIRQSECRLDDLEKELSDVKDKLEKKDLEYEELKKKYEEAVMKLDEMKTKEQLQQLYNPSHSKKLIECLYLLTKYYDALSSYKPLSTNIPWTQFVHEYRRLYLGLSAEDQKKCTEIGNKYYEDLQKKRMNSQ